MLVLVTLFKPADVVGHAGVKFKIFLTLIKSKKCRGATTLTLLYAHDAFNIANYKCMQYYYM